IMRREANRIEVQVDAEAPSVLVLSELDYPAWKARLDGQSARVYRANYLFRAVAVPAGRHLVSFEYDDENFRRGAWITGVTALLAAGVLLPWPPFVAAGVLPFRGGRRRAGGRRPPDSPQSGDGS